MRVLYSRSAVVWSDAVLMSSSLLAWYGDFGGAPVVTHPARPTARPAAASAALIQRDALADPDTRCMRWCVIGAPPAPGTALRPPRGLRAYLGRPGARPANRLARKESLLEGGRD